MAGRKANKDVERFFVRQHNIGRISVHEDGTVLNNNTKNKIGAIGSGRYYKISLKDIDENKIKHIQIHRLVYLIYGGEIPDGYEIDHVNGDKYDNSIHNLEAVTPSENSRRSAKNNPRHHLFKKGNEFVKLSRHYKRKHGIDD